MWYNKNRRKNKWGVKMLEAIWSVLFFIVQNIFYALVLVVGFFSGFIIIGLVLHYIEKIKKKHIPKDIWKYTAVVGIPVHETGHLTIAALFGCEIFDVKLLDLKERDGTYGYVTYGIYQTIPHYVGMLFINAGPLILATFLLWLPVYLGAGASIEDHSPIEAMRMFWGQYDVIWFWLFLIGGFFIAPYASLSPNDMMISINTGISVTTMVWIILMVYQASGGNMDFVFTVAQFGLELIMYLVVLVPFALLHLMVGFIAKALIKK